MTDKQFKVDFFCVGVAKAGTTTLHELLDLQDKICLPKIKETNYFSFGWKGKPTYTGPLDESSVNRPTVTSFEEYRSQFDYSHGDYVGEICPSYVLPGTANKLHSHNPNAKIIILLRDPVSRAFSNYQHLVRDGRESLSFESALAAEEERLAQGWEWFWGLKNNGFYTDAVSEYIDTFGKDNLKVIYFEEFIRNQQSHLAEILDFLSIDSTNVVFEDIRSNQSGLVSDKWKFAHRLLLAEGGLNSFLRTILPEGFRKKLGGLLKSASTVKGGMDGNTKLKLIQDFDDDINRLHQLIGGNPNVWQRNGDVS